MLQSHISCIELLTKRRYIDYNDIFSPIVKLNTISLVLYIVVTENLLLEQMDVKTTFLHTNLDLEENIYIKQPQSFLSRSNSELICRLRKSLYSCSEISAETIVQEI